MNTVAFLLDVLKYTLSGLMVLACAYFIFKQQFGEYYNLKKLEYKSALMKDILPLRLQAYERMTLFLERINPSNLLVRLHNGPQSAQEFHQRILAEIRAEYQHNVSQQIYISNDAWEIVKRVKEDAVTIVNMEMSQLGADATAIDLSRAVLARLDQLDEDVFGLALTVLKADIQEM